MVNSIEVAAWPEDGFETVPSCPVCGEDKGEILHKNLTDRVFFCAPGKWTMYQCESCQCGYLNPRPNEETIGKAYENYYTHTNTAIVRDNFSSKIRLRLKNGYLNYRFGTKFYPSSYMGVLIASLMRDKKQELDLLLRHLPKANADQELLDLGCGDGEFLINAQSAGWKVVGVDLDRKAVETASARGLDVRIGNIDVFNGAEEQFNVITMSHVIEHVHQPVEVLKASYQLLKPEGFLWLETPNIGSIGHGLFGENWFHLDPPRHLILYSLDALTNLLLEVGFSNVEVLPYRRVCKDSFGSSKAIEKGLEAFYSKSKPEVASNIVKDAENVARHDPSQREFITIKAWK